MQSILLIGGRGIDVKVFCLSFNFYWNFMYFLIKRIEVSSGFIGKGRSRLDFIVDSSTLRHLGAPAQLSNKTIAKNSRFSHVKQDALTLHTHSPLLLLLIN